MKIILRIIVWVLVALAGAWAYVVIALANKEEINSVYILIAALCSYAIGFRFYSKWISLKVLRLNSRRATPCEVHDDGKDFVRTNKWVVFGHHFAAIAGPGPLVGPVLAAQFGYLPGILWIMIGAVLGGAVHDFVTLFASIRRNGKSLGEMVRDEINTVAGFISLIAILAIMTILLAVLALVVVKALADSPWGVFTVGATIPIALFMGCYMRFIRAGKVFEATVIGVVLLLLAVWGGKLVYEDPDLSKRFGLGAETLAWSIMIYGLAASILPVWLLLAPRDYLSTFMKLGTIAILAIGIFFVLPTMKMPALTKFIDGSGLVVSGKLFPFCFITIACGAISGFHALISSGVTPKIITRENYARHIGYGAMILESLVATMALIAACTLEPGIYLSVNIKGSPEAVVNLVNQHGFTVTVEEMDNLAKLLGETTLFGRTGGAATLAVGMAMIFAKFVRQHGLDLWYHFAIMFEALFILTTLDAGTRVGRYLLHDFLGHIWKPLGDTRKLFSNLVTSLIMVSAWGYFLIQGVRDPLGGVNTLWPLFGIANQLLACIALCLGTTIILKMQLKPAEPYDSPEVKRTPWKSLITLIPLIWLLSVTVTAALQKIYSPNPQIGFLAQANVMNAKLISLEEQLAKLGESGNTETRKELLKEIQTTKALQFNHRVDAVVAGFFLVLVGLILSLSAYEWLRLLSKRRAPDLKETEPVWLPDYALAEGKNTGRALGFLGIIGLLIKELSGEAEIDRLVNNSNNSELKTGTYCICNVHSGKVSRKEAFVQMTERRFKTINRCC